MRRTLCRIAVRFLLVAIAIVAFVAPAPAQQASISAWDAANFRSWTFIPDWVASSDLNAFPTNGMYGHVSDVVYFEGVRPMADGSLHYAAGATTELNTLKNQAAANGFRLHMSMFTVYPQNSTSDVYPVWDSIVSNASYRSTFVDNIVSLLNTYNMSGINLDWERPSGSTDWGNYTQLAKDLQAKLAPLGKEVSVDDFGSTDTSWDASPIFDAHAYNQLFIMGYNYSTALNVGFADGKLALTQQGADKAFTNQQLALGIGTYGQGPTAKTLKQIIATDPDIPYNVNSWSDGTNTWTIESRDQVRTKTQLAIDRNMSGIFFWTLDDDATNNKGLHRVAQHYLNFKKDLPDLNLDGRIDAADANQLATKMGTAPGWTGTDTPDRFDKFYLNGNWELGDHDGNGVVNQKDADWLAGRFTALGVNIPDRLAYTGTFETFQDARGTNGRWRVIRDAQNKLPETGNFTQNALGSMVFSGNGVGFNKHSNSTVTIRNQNGIESNTNTNTLPRVMQSDLATPLDLGQNQETYVTFLIRQNMAALSTSQQMSDRRTLSLQFLDAAGVNQFDFTFFGIQHKFVIQSEADAAGEIASAGGFSSDTVYMFIAKLTGNGAGANTMQASLIPSGSTVGDFSSPSFTWMLTANGSANYNPVITDLQWLSPLDSNYTVSNVWIGNAATFFGSGSGGSLNGIPEPSTLMLAAILALLIPALCVGTRSSRRCRPRTA